jgi:hypothetical protein
MVLTTVADATPEWVTTTLHRGGHLSRGHATSITVRRVHEEQVGSVGYFLAVRYSPDAPETAPRNLFLKLPRSAESSAAVTMHGAREVRMYQAVARDQHTLPIIPCYDAAYDPRGGGYHVLLADLSATHDQPAWHLSIPERYMIRTVDALAALHAYWWEHPQLQSGIVDLPTAESVEQEIRSLRAAYVKFSRVVGDQLSPADWGIYEQVLLALPALWRDRPEIAGQTMVHGDAHFWNFLYPKDEQDQHTYMLDWQSYHISAGPQDLAYTVVLRYPHRTADNERTLVLRYYEGLRQHGVGTYTWERCWRDYRRMVAEHVLYPMRWWMNGLPREFWGMFLSRSLAGFRELECAAVLD